MDLKPGYVFVASFVVSGLTVGAGLAPLLNSNQITVGFWGAIGGGIVGGAMTLAAGWLAWTAAQRQIQVQQATLDLANAENRRRLIHLLREARDASEHVEKDAERLHTGMLHWQALVRRIAFKPGGYPSPPDFHFSSAGWSHLISDPDFWRINVVVADAIRAANDALLNYNARPLTIDRIEGCRDVGLRAKAIRESCDALLLPLLLIEHSEARQ